MLQTNETDYKGERIFAGYKADSEYELKASSRPSELPQPIGTGQMNKERMDKEISTRSRCILYPNKKIHLEVYSMSGPKLL